MSAWDDYLAEFTELRHRYSAALKDPDQGNADQIEDELTGRALGGFQFPEFREIWRNLGPSVPEVPGLPADGTP